MLKRAASNVELHLGTWQGRVNFSVAPMDDFKVVLGMDFLRQVTMLPMPSFSTVCILEKGSPCMVPTIEGDHGSPSKQLSAMQLAKGQNEVLRDNELYVKESKCIFAQEEVNFLGHIFGHRRIRMSGAKVKAIMEWEAPTKVTELRSFLGLVNYYHRFIQGYSPRAAPLTDLLKKGKPWVRSDECQRAFDDLKVAVSQEPVLALNDFTKPFEVHTDASDLTIGGVLM
ncbi:Uncharacterized mitochondrial protein AtMg00860 [Striga hermonthica]|uniref:Uncharacterized mitochondrial protein AtMg00860 n=1 Tax=Striga hermonthica TaxID=68872 RepID=A0A9N7MYT9_STRHE|nr:Uncharacterized mitochondrial protein AtMg00860 [Striga hermonthica]